MSHTHPDPKQPDFVPAHRSGWRRVIPVKVEIKDGARRLHILWPRLAAITGCLLAFGYLALVTSVWAFLLFQRGVTTTRFVDILLPYRWSIQRTRIGDHYVAVGKRQIAAGEYWEALTSLRVGLAKSPSNLEGRLLLAQLLTGARRPDLAEKVLLDGLPNAARDPSYLRTMFGFLLQNQSDDLVIARARDLIGQSSLPAESRSLAALAAASACYFRGHYDEADDLIKTHRLDRNYDGRLLAAQIEWERGYRELAIERLRALIDQFPSREQASIQLAAWLRLLGRHDEFRRLTLLRQLSTPDNPAPRVELLRVLHSETPAVATREADALLHDSGQNENLLLALADYAADIGDPGLARRVYAQCRQLNRGWEAAAFLNVEALIVARDYRGALDLTRELLETNRDWAKRYYTLFNSLQSIAYYGLGDTASASLYLANFLGQSDLRADNLLAVAQRFVDVGARTEARDVLVHAASVDPRNQAVLTRLVELELDLNQTDALPVHLRRLIAMRRPSPIVLRSAATKLGSDLFLFSRERDDTLVALQTALAATH